MHKTCSRWAEESNTDSPIVNMGRNVIHSNLLQCPNCSEIFEAPSEVFLRDDFPKPYYEFSIRCQKCIQSSQNLQLKQITGTFQSILMYCKNRINGCNVELPSCDMPAHEINCEYRPVRCIWHLQCEQKEISFCNYRKHLENQHQTYIKKVHLNEEHQVVIKMLKDHVVKVSSVVCDERKQLYFTRRCSIDLQENTFMVCVHYIGKREDAKKFIYKVKIHQGLESLQTFYEYSAYCAPCVETPNAPDAHSHCIILQPKKLFLTDDYLSEMKYSVTIKRVKENYDI